MRHFGHISPTAREGLFFREPCEFSASSSARMLSAALGATLYSPATRPRLADDVIKQAGQGVVSMVLCLEDSIDDAEVVDAEANLVSKCLIRPGHPLHVSLSDLSLPREPGTAVLVTLRPAADADPLFAGSGAVGPSAAQPDAVLQAELTDLLDRTTGTLLSGGADTSNELLTAVAAELCEQLGDWAVLDLTAATGSLRRSAVLGLGGSTDTTLEKAVTHQDPYGCKVVAEAAATGFASLFVRPDDLDCLGSDDSGASLCVRADVTSLLVLPLTSNRAGDGRILGVLTVLRSGARPSFSLAEARAAEMVARHMAIARERGTG